MALTPQDRRRPLSSHHAVSLLPTDIGESCHRSMAGISVIFLGLSWGKMSGLQIELGCYRVLVKPFALPPAGIVFRKVVGESAPDSDPDPASDSARDDLRDDLARIDGPRVTL